jgi:hypothetical protein
MPKSQNEMQYVTMKEVVPYSSNPVDSTSKKLRAERIQVLQIDNQTLRRRLQIVEEELERVRREYHHELGNLDMIMNTNARIKAIITDDEQNLNNSIESKEVYELRRNNDVIAKDIEIANQDIKFHQDRVDKVQTECED